MALPPTFSREFDLLRCCARVEPDNTAQSAIQDLAGAGAGGRAPDWALVARLADDHGITGLLYRSLHAFAWESVPPDVQNQLTQANRANVAGTLQLSMEFYRLLGRFREARIPVTPIKGPVAEALLYHDLALRSFSDLDFLVQTADVPRATELLEQDGYATRADVPAAHQADFLRHHHEYTFRRATDRALVEVQWEFAQRYFTFPLNFQEAWGRREEILMGGILVDVLCPEDFLIYLCGHGLKHLWTQMKWVCDIAELVRSFPHLDWDTTLQRARQNGGLRMLLLGLTLAVELLGARLPIDVAASIASDPTVNPLAMEVMANMAADVHPGVMESLRFPLKARERALDQARYCFRLALRQSPEDWRFARLPQSLSFLYPLIRPIRLVRARTSGSVTTAEE